jgi:hypothetical protein
MKKNTLKNAQLITLFSGIILGIGAFIGGASLTIDNPIKQNLLFVIAFGELLVIFSLISIFTNKSK